MSLTNVRGNSTRLWGNRLDGQVVFVLTSQVSSSCIPRHEFRSGFLLVKREREKKRERERTGALTVLIFQRAFNVARLSFFSPFASFRLRNKWRSDVYGTEYAKRNRKSSVRCRIQSRSADANRQWCSHAYINILITSFLKDGEIEVSNEEASYSRVNLIDNCKF